MNSKMKRVWALFLKINLFILFCGNSFSQTANITDRDIVKPVGASRGMVVSSEPLATQAGREILLNGGNAVDAAVAVGFALAVTLPRAGNIGGGGFMLIRSAGTGKMEIVDYREKAPSKAHQDMFLKDGDVDSDLSQYSHLASGVPGTVAGLLMALDKYGSMSLKDVMEPAIRLAEEGFEMPDGMSKGIRSRRDRFRKWDSTRKIFFKPDGSDYETGDLFIQKDLAQTLRLISMEGRKGFYRGRTAALIVQQMETHGGWITEKDLADYRPVIREPVHGTYRGYDIFSVPPPGSGGVHIVQMLNVLEAYDIASSGHNTAKTIHFMAEAMKRSFADRARYMGDPDFIEVPVSQLTSKSYAASLVKQIHPDKATPSSDIHAGTIPGYESDETTHFSVVDYMGNVVSNTTTINFSYGSGIVVQGAGFLLNNEMDDFSAKPGAPNAYGLTGGNANAIEPGKRMLSAMSPVIVQKDGRPFIVTGSPGGPRIITTTLQVIVNVIDHHMNIQEAVNAPRIHHQWFPDEIRVEEGISLDTIGSLKRMGHTVNEKATMGRASSILIDLETGDLYGAADPRTSGLAAGY
jgi:gamma-glutamyltranspeptidase/glutathione hydrolase